MNPNIRSKHLPLRRRGKNKNIASTDPNSPTDITNVQNPTLQNVLTNGHPFTPPPPSTEPAKPMPLIP